MLQVNKNTALLPSVWTSLSVFSLAKIGLALWAWASWHHLNQVRQCYLLLRRLFPHLSMTKALQSSNLYVTIVFLGNTANLLFGLMAPKLAWRTLTSVVLRLPTRNFRYGPHERHVLDLYGTTQPPSSCSLKPVVIFIHGGAWALTSKFHYGSVGLNLERFDVVTVVPSYRTFPHGEVIDMMDDLQAVVAWTIANIARYGGDPKRITLAGHSSGAHLGALLVVQSALRDCACPDPAEAVHHVNAFVGLSGPYDIKDQYTFETNRELMESRRCIRHFMAAVIFSAYSPPSLVVDASKDIATRLPSFHLFHGVEDQIVPVDAAHKFAKQLRRIGAPAHVKEFPHGHIDGLLALMGDAIPSKDQDFFMDSLL
ncbi:hypothetical protein LEN26_008491 [Aphanomyces euteiches]|nr:hypothetical protein LEN26_008491 [Aphanomyces euteiches]